MLFDRNKELYKRSLTLRIQTKFIFKLINFRQENIFFRFFKVNLLEFNISFHVIIHRLLRIIKFLLDICSVITVTENVTLAMKISLKYSFVVLCIIWKVKPYVCYIDYLYTRNFINACERKGRDLHPHYLSLSFIQNCSQYVNSCLSVQNQRHSLKKVT